MADLAFRVMGSAARIVVDGPDGLADIGRARLEDLERRWSRFRPDSEISLLNRFAGMPWALSADSFTLVERSVAAARATDGRFDPTMLHEIRALGYDRTHELLAVPRPGPAQLRASSATLRPRWWEDIELDRSRREVVLPAAVGLDPGGIGKGLAADLVVDQLLDLGATGVFVTVGGDIRFGGRPIRADAWTVTVEDPHDPPSSLATMRLGGGGVATTSSVRRRWVHDGRVVHHVIDPSTGSSVRSRRASVTAVAGEAWWAEAFATSVFVGGAAAAGHLRANNTAALIVDTEGAVVRVGDLDLQCRLEPERTSS